MKKLLQPTILTLVFTFIILLSFGQDDQKNTEGKTLRIAFYNVENLFDTIDDPEINDADFLPGARIPWTSDRYEVKLSHLAEVINGLSEPQAIAIMGLCEVENKTVLGELVKSPQIIRFRYQFIHHDSPDERGIDNAMIYDAEQFRPLAVNHIPVVFPSSPSDRTRDILYVKGLNPKIKGDTLHIFINHWPSRSEGKEISEPKRIRAAETLKAVTDSLFKLNPLALIVIMGDLNDEPADKSLVDGLQALPPSQKPAGNKLYNLMEPLYKQGKGTLWYKDWDLFDQVIISGNLMNKTKGLFFPGTEGKIFEADYLFYKSNDGSSRPNRTAAKDYYGGYSDHLPVYLDLNISK